MSTLPKRYINELRSVALCAKPDEEMIEGIADCDADFSIDGFTFSSLDSDVSLFLTELFSIPFPKMSWKVTRYESAAEVQGLVASFSSGEVFFAATNPASSSVVESLLYTLRISSRPCTGISTHVVDGGSWRIMVGVSGAPELGISPVLTRRISCTLFALQDFDRLVALRCGRRLFVMEVHMSDEGVPVGVVTEVEEVGAVPIHISLGTIELPLPVLAKLRPGIGIELDIQKGHSVELLLGDVSFARGQLVCDGGRLLVSVCETNSL